MTNINSKVKVKYFKYNLTNRFTHRFSTGSSPEMSLWSFERGLHLWTRNSSGLLETRRQDNHQENENYLFRLYYSTPHCLGLCLKCRPICSNCHDSLPMTHGLDSWPESGLLRTLASLKTKKSPIYSWILVTFRHLHSMKREWFRLLLKFDLEYLSWWECLTS